MTEDLRLFLVANCSPEMYDVIMKAFDILDELYSPEIQDVFQNIIFDQDRVDTVEGESLFLVLAQVNKLLDDILTEHLIELNSETDLNRKVIIISALLAIQDYEDTETIINILNQDIASEEKLSEVLSLACEMDKEELLLEIEVVNDSLLDKMLSNIEETTPTVIQEDLVSREAYIQEVSLFEEFSKNMHLVSIGMLKSDVNPGYPFEIYANIIGRDIEAMDPEVAAEELIAMALMSIDGKSNPKAIINKHISKYVSDLRRITQIDIKVTELLLKYQTFKDQKSLVPKEIG